ncbi:MAG: ribose 5-phosphate isomerase [Omnitrophica WOR_2 bacterium SM23_29]|nr:MAG: ribose 5-phosphate isomerase [Omnitrophica WOR_2 bacterium SM23_29]
MRIAIGADHGGFELKAKIIKYLRRKGHTVRDFGTFSPESCDYTKYGFIVAREVGRGKYSRGILICKSGVGMSIVANKVHGVRAVAAPDMKVAKFSREHNDSNVIVFGSKFIKTEKAKRILDVWFKTKFLSGRHLRRVRQIRDIEDKIM